MSTNPELGGQAPTAGSAAAQQLRESLADLIEESKTLRQDVRAAEKARRRANGLALGIMGLLVLFVFMLMLLSWQNNRLAQQVNDTNDQIADCTTPGGQCYQRGTSRTGEAVGDIIRANIFMAQCARLYPGEEGPVFDRKLEQCVAERLVAAAKARAQATASPSPAPSGAPR